MEVTAGQVEVRYLESGVDRLVFVFNHGKQATQATVSLQMPPGTFWATDVSAGTAVPLVRMGQKIRFETRLEADGVQVLRLRPR